MEVRGPYRTGTISVTYLVAGGLIRVIRGVGIPPDCRITRISSGGPEIAV